jgi:signal transduction histidine kinase
MTIHPIANVETRPGSCDRTEWALRERVKELTCLYGIAQVAGTASLPVDEIVQRIVDLLPPAWQFPEVARARITIDGRPFVSRDFREGGGRQVAPVVVEGRTRGAIEVFYFDARPPADEGPFLAEERSLVNEVARQIGLILERRETETERARLQDQLLHADRLATLGQLAAGVAHELNEPLGAILGYAQLTLRNFGMPDQSGRNLEKIVRASLHAREVVRKLLLFARQHSVEKRPVSLNEIVKESLFLLESRCRKGGVRVVAKLDPALPPITADGSQIEQVVLNLAVNAVQAMPTGGVLEVETAAEGGWGRLTVKDEGVGMEQETVRQAFDPFFTTKDVGQGTGLGLSVVHGIVTSHGGSLKVESVPGRGSRFDLRFPIDPGAAAAPTKG